MNIVFVVGTQAIFKIIKCEWVIATKGGALLARNEETVSLFSNYIKNTFKKCYLSSKTTCWMKLNTFLVPGENRCAYCQENSAFCGHASYFQDH